jgi:hypothetical protein
MQVELNHGTLNFKPGLENARPGAGHEAAAVADPLRRRIPVQIVTNNAGTSSTRCRCTHTEQTSRMVRTMRQQVSGLPVFELQSLSLSLCGLGRGRGRWGEGGGGEGGARGRDSEGRSMDAAMRSFQLLPRVKPKPARVSSNENAGSHRNRNSACVYCVLRFHNQWPNHWARGSPRRVSLRHRLAAELREVFPCAPCA